jgi:hypothetical protein
MQYKCICIAVLAILLNGAERVHSDTPIQNLLGSLDLESNNASIDYTNAVMKLAHPDSNTLKAILDEVMAVGTLERMQKWDEFGDRLFRLSKAFDRMGTNLTPLLSDLEVEFLSGDSVSASGRALLKIGGDAWTPLRQGLTNENSRVQLCAVETMAYAEGTNAVLALPFLRGFLTNDTENIQVQTVVTIGRMGIDIKTKKTLLIQSIENVTNVTSKCMGLKAPGGMGKDEDVITILKRASKDTNPTVRHTAAESLREIGVRE